ncbi:hypothetical protein RXV86_00430 [Alisedimentitalea sp. MJ-SS2]|uniref:hypothetical protein n=1 Tax=Aliisedimentitalea sp. MJ-SS2 TaxID=3049795 RepID=UPI00290FC109|nr:hypothetical protein [Alisedimentitalea sp. MJ-SS2]MDU8925842.1 hypothetical protein [Alisedimentitalea sp. MJ-SS2]
MIQRLFLACALVAVSTAAGASCDGPEVKPSAAAWQVEETDDGWIARSEAYPGLDVPLHMASPSVPELYEFVTLPRYQHRIGLLQYFAGEPGTSHLVTLIHNAILDLEAGRVIGDAPFSEDCVPTEWSWSDGEVSVQSSYGHEVFDLR